MQDVLERYVGQVIGMNWDKPQVYRAIPHRAAGADRAAHARAATDRASSARPHG